MSTPIEQNTIDLRSILSIITAMNGSDSSTSNAYFTDQSTNQTYSMYVSEGELTMSPSTYGTGVNSLSLTDVVTGNVYEVYVSDGKLMMTMVEE